MIGDYSNWVYEVGVNNLGSSYTTGEGDLIQYVSPSFGGLTLHGVAQVRGDGDSAYDNRDDSSEYPYQLAAEYSLDALTLTVVMDSNDSSADASNENSYGVAAEYTIDALTLDAYYDMRKGIEGFGDNDDFDEGGRDQFGLMGTYALGANTFRLSYEWAEEDEGDLKSDVITVQALHNLNDNLYVYVEALQRNNELGSDDEEINELNVGGVYYF